MSQESSWPAVTCARLVWPSRVPEEGGPQDVERGFLWSEDPSKSSHEAAAPLEMSSFSAAFVAGLSRTTPVILLRVQCPAVRSHRAFLQGQLRPLSQMPPPVRASLRQGPGTDSLGAAEPDA